MIARRPQRRGQLVVAWCVLVARIAGAAEVCELHERRSGLVARDKACEATILDAEFARFEEQHHRTTAPSLAHALTKHKFALPHRDRFPDLLTRLGLNGTAVEIGVREGHWSRMFLERWRGRAYHGIDPLQLNADLAKYETTMPEVYAYGVETIAKLDADARFRFHHGLDTAFVDEFADGSLDFVYIDSVHTYAAVRDTFARWWPKVRRGGAIGGHDFCVANALSREEGRAEWPAPDVRDTLVARRVPRCGVYACIAGEFCYPKDIARKGRDKFGFSGVAHAALEAAEREGTRLQFTGEAGVVGNPSWWAVKP